MMKLVEIDIGQPPRDPRGYNDNNGWLCTVICSHPHGDILSYNSVSYWFNLDRYNIGGRIAKDCPEGKQLCKMIADGVSSFYLEKTITKWCVQRLSPEQFMDILEWVRDESLKEGKNDVRRSLAEVLEIES